MIRHIVLFRMRSDASEEQTEQLMQDIRALPDVISEVRFFEVERDEIGNERSATFGLLSHFDDMEALQRYRDHPDHQAVLEKIRALTEWTRAWDYTIPADSTLR